MWKAPHCSAIRPSSTSARFASTSRAISAPYSWARPGTAAMSGSSYWPMSAVYVHGTAPFSRIHATATDVSSPPEKAMPTRSPTGREESTLVTPQIMHHPAFSCEPTPRHIPWSRCGRCRGRGPLRVCAEGEGRDVPASGCRVLLLAVDRGRGGGGRGGPVDRVLAVDDHLAGDPDDLRAAA